MYSHLQYNPFGDLKTYTESDERIFNHSHGSIIAISYGDARKVGVKRGMRGKEARALCPSLQLVQVPTLNGKADLTMYRRHGQEVLNVLAEADHSCGVHTSKLHSLYSVCSGEHACNPQVSYCVRYISGHLCKVFLVALTGLLRASV